MPSRKSATCRLNAGHEKREKMPNGRKNSNFTSTVMPTAASTQLMSVLASAQPGPPSAGTPAPPKMNHVLSGNLRIRPPTCRNITSRGLPTALVSEL